MVAMKGQLKAGGRLLVQGAERRGERPGSRWTAALALAFEIALLVWLSVAVGGPWALSASVALPVAGVLTLNLSFGSERGRARRPWPVSVALGGALAVAVVVASLLAILLFLVLAQGAISDKGILPLLLSPLLLGFVLMLDVGLPLFMALTFVLVLVLGEMMDADPVAFLAVLLVVAMGVGTVLFPATSHGQARMLRRLPGDRRLL